jgi:hypothetical protein
MSPTELKQFKVLSLIKRSIGLFVQGGLGWIAMGVRSIMA